MSSSYFLPLSHTHKLITLSLLHPLTPPPSDSSTLTHLLPHIPPPSTPPPSTPPPSHTSPLTPPPSDSSTLSLLHPHTSTLHTSLTPPPSHPPPSHLHPHTPPPSHLPHTPRVQPEYVSLSFPTISSSGPNGAIIHYKCVWGRGGREGVCGRRGSGGV